MLAGRVGAGDPLVLIGAPGIGKTTLWEASIEAARSYDLQVLSASPGDREAQLSFTGLIDLFDGVADDALARLPGPQRSALDVALLRREPAAEPPEPHAIGLGVLNGLRALAARAPVLVAVDDVQWLDPPRPRALVRGAAARHEPVGFLLARRPAPPSTLEQALARRVPQHLQVGPLGLAATRSFLSARLGLSLPRRLLHRIVESTEGNPLFALELGRTVIEQRDAGDRCGDPRVGRDRRLDGDARGPIDGAGAHAAAHRCPERRRARGRPRRGRRPTDDRRRPRPRCAARRR